MATPRFSRSAPVRPEAPPPDQGGDSSPPCRYEADVAPGLEGIARDELRHLFGRAIQLADVARPGLLAFAFSGALAQLLRPRTILAVYLVQRFPVPRPRALLGDQHFRALQRQIAAVRALLPPDAYATLYVSAAGSESSTLLRLKAELAAATGLRLAAPEAHEGDLHLRFRRPPGGEDGWEALVRLSPRPLGARPWRVCNLEGALNATVAHAMTQLTQPTAPDHFLNLACGSGTLLIERAIGGPAARLLGCDISAEAVACARLNATAAGVGDAIELRQEDARALDLPDASIDALCADLPFGHLVGSHAENLTLYPVILAEAARVARSDAPFVLLTHEVRLMESLLADSAEWTTDATMRVTLGGLHPRIFALRRR